MKAGVKDFDYRHWLAVAARYSRRSAESADLLHDCLLDAIRADRTDFSLDATQRWFAGVIRNRAAMTARSASRRQKRESLSTAPSARDVSVPSQSFIDSLTPSARAVATLVLAGLNRDEIIGALKLTPTSFRQRLTAIRRSWRQSKFDADDQSATGDLPDLGLMRRALLWQVRRVGGIGTHDPDGHLLVISELARSQSPTLRQQKRKQELR